MMKILIGIVVAGFVLGGCGGGSGTPGMQDATDEPVQPDATPAAACTAEMDYGVVDVLDPIAESEDDPDISGTVDVIIVENDVAGNLSSGTVVLELWNELTVFSGGSIVPGVYEITGDELQYASCGICLMLEIDRDGMDANDVYMATGGTVEITAVSPNIVGTASNITFQHVNIDPETSESTQHPDNCLSMFMTWSFDVPVVPAAP